MYRIISEFIEIKNSISNQSYLTNAQRRALWGAFCRIRWWRFWYEKISSKTPTHARFLGFRVRIDTVGSFYGTFQEVFIHQDYAFVSAPKDTVFIDAGANIGLATLYLTWRFPGKQVHAFEAHPDTFLLLKNNIEINKLVNVHLYQKALHDSNGAVTITGDLRAATVDTDMYTYKESTTASFNVESVTLSSVCNDIGGDKFMLKMDIEGSEYAVLKELIKTSTLSKFQVILFEFHYIPDEPNRLSELKTLLSEAGFLATQVTFDRNDHFIIKVIPQ